jgi:hypothetical protein
MTAAHVIQDAVDAALAGDEVVVAKGVYATGGRVVYGQLTNRVAVTKPMLLRSAYGPDETFIQGYQVPGTIYGDAAVRCVYLTNGASLAGFTLMAGGTRDNSGNYEEQNGGGVWCELTDSIVSNCVVKGNCAFNRGGGSYQATLLNCILSNNSAGLYGGGASGGTLNNCTLDGNSASYSGGGSYGGTLNNCTLEGNSTDDYGDGGGAFGATLSNCALVGNSADTGGGSSDCVLNNCALVGNSASSWGGGAFIGELYNCTLTGNSAPSGGGVRGSIYAVGEVPVVLNNCVVYHNTADYPFEANYGPDTILNYCCTSPLPLEGINNIAADPLLTDSAHLSASSPCRGAGSGDYASGTDIDGEPWASPPSIGCDEYHPGATGPLQISLNADYTNVALGFSVGFSAGILGHATSNRWDFGDGVRTISQVFRPSASHAWVDPGSYLVTLTAYNETYPSGVSASVAVQVLAQPVYYVSLGSADPQPPFNSWGTAATNIQDAVDAASLPGALVLVSNGVYAIGGRTVGGDNVTNRVTVDRPLALRSVNGPQLTFITGWQPGTNFDAIRCVYLHKSASLCGFTLTNGYGYFGGGVWCAAGSALLTNCVLVGNRADDGGSGGGAYGGTLVNCAISNNSAFWYGGGAVLATLNGCTLVSNVVQSAGGGAYNSSLTNCTLNGNLVDPGFEGGGATQSILDHCTLTGNSASQGAGVFGCILYNCTVRSNTADYGGGAYGGTLNNCVLNDNSAFYNGGGAFGGTLNNCTLTDNSADDYGEGGGAFGGTLNNCIVYLNAAQSSANYDSNCLLTYCCTTPLPANGFGNITNDPLFVDLARGNLRLQPNSPCINAGNNAYAPAGPDLDGNRRIAGGTVDIGAYEFQNPTSLISYAWLQQFGLPTDGSADFADPDHDGMNNWQEWRCGTNPTNALSALRMISALPTGTIVTISWQSVVGVSYFLECSTNLVGPSPVFTPVAAGIPGQDGTTSYWSTPAIGSGPAFYRVGVGASATNYAISFEGFGSYVLIPSGEAINPGTNSLTIEAWIKTADTTNLQMIVSKYECGGGCPSGVANSFYEFWINPGGVLVAGLRTSDVQIGQLLFGNRVVADGTWHHVAMERDQARGQLLIFVDGLIDSHTALQPGLDGPIQNDDGEDDPVVIGGQQSPGVYTFEAFFNGTIDEVRIWSAARSQADLLANMNHPMVSPQPNLLAYWNFDEAGLVVRDLSGQNNSGSLVNCNRVFSTIPFASWAATPVEFAGPSLSFKANVVGREPALHRVGVGN